MVKMRCPHCGRLFDDHTPGEKYTLPEHDNYMKTARCNGSGLSFVNSRTGRSVRVNATYDVVNKHRDPGMNLNLALVLGLLSRPYR